MEVIALKNHNIITPMSPRLDEYETARIVEEIEMLADKKVGLDLSYVKDCTIDFFEKIKNIGNISLFNVSSDIFAILTLMKLDKSLNIYVSESDFLENKRRVLSRKFSLLIN